ncbi:MAG: 6-phosphogluconolactonase [Anaerolineaceae bacterium]|nr:6-phosphogluconolactonase [Anaerolineaceae bacterium]
MGQIRVYKDHDALIEAAADYVLGCYDQAVEDHDYFAVALSGGSTPRALYELLASPERAQHPGWAKVHIFWGDERNVPPEHADSNYRMAREALLDQVALPRSNVHRIQGELNPAQAAAEYEQELRRFFARTGGKIRFDLVLLGLGDDGHTASLFPGTLALKERERAVVANPVPQLDTWRISLTFPVINDASHVAFLVSGAAKAGALVKVLEGPHQPYELPSQLVQPVDGELVWLLDQDAAASLSEQ